MLYLAHMPVPTCSSKAILPCMRGTASVASDQRRSVAFPRYTSLSMAAMVCEAAESKAGFCLQLLQPQL